LASGAWRIFVVSPNRNTVLELSALLSRLLPTAQVVEIDEYPSSRNTGDLAEFPLGSLCFLDLSSDREAGLLALSTIAQAAPRLTIIALVPNSDPQQILQALRTGARDFLTSPLEEGQLKSVLDKVAQIIPELIAERGRVVTVVPAKGGCGASTVAFNVSAGIRRSGSQRTLLADLDPHTGTQAFQMKLKPSFSFVDAVGHASGLDIDLWKGIVQQAQGMDVLLPPENIADGGQDVTDSRALLEFATRLYNNIVVDMGMPYGEWALSAVRAADEVLLVSTNELPALQAAQRVLNYYESQGIPRQRIRLVLNRFRKEVGLSKEMVETALQTEVYQVLMSDYEAVQRALLDGKPIAQATVLGKQLGQLAARLAGTDDKPKPAEKKKTATGLSGFFNLFSRSST